ncbi:MAG: ABC transporter ATP-binding protein [Pirellulales bacterium]|nr:ABC transporter ATP-binding protein [Pirellulales bacterium]
MSELAIDIQAVHKSFRNNQVLNGMTLQVKRGRTFAFLGRNGAGKTTTIQMLLGLLNRDDGTIRVLGHDPQSDALSVRAKVGYLAEDQTMYGWMKCADILRFVAPFYPTWDHNLALKYAQEFEVPLQTKIKHLSKGQNVRLGLVLALAHRPELVILDDPALGLDPIMRKQFNRDLITHLQGEGRTVFYSSHLLYEVEPVADEVAILDQGRVIRQAETESLRRDVKQISFSVTAASLLGEDITVLDRRQDGDELAVTVAGAAEVIERLQREGARHRVVELNLDEIFEAYVTGNNDNPANAVDLQPAGVE